MKRESSKNDQNKNNLKTSQKEDYSLNINEDAIILGRAYRDGHGVVKNLALAEKWMEEAFNNGETSIIGELCEVLNEIGDVNSEIKIAELSRIAANAGDRYSMRRLGRAYRDGKGVERDLNEAAKWLRQAFKKGANKADSELCSVLLEIGTPEALMEMIEVAKKSASNGNGHSMLFLGRAYRYGTGVKQDYSEAAKWIKKAVDINIKNSEKELKEIELLINTNQKPIKQPKSIKTKPKTVYEEKKHCCGCSSCMNICPKQAITMEEDEEGFLYPTIDGKKCIGCYKCKEICAFEKGFESTILSETPTSYGMIIKDESIRSLSRSGGVFTAVSDWILERNGCVYGVGFGEHFKAIHKCANTKEERDEFRGSKYVQSDVGKIFQEIKIKLADGKLVMFSGTPCQVAGLKQYCSDIDTSKLYLVDLICHGVPSPAIWEDYISMREHEKNSPIKAVNFRNKSQGWSKHIESYVVDEKEYYSDVYAKLFYTNAFLRPSCSECLYTGMQRPSDITLADFWHSERFLPNFHTDDKGCSLCIATTEKGKELIKAVLNRFYYKETTGQRVLARNHRSPTKSPKNRKEYWSDYNYKGIEYVVDKYCNYKPIINDNICIHTAKSRISGNKTKNHYDIALCGATVGSNYGGIITYYALYKAMVNLGKSVAIIPPHIPEHGKSGGLVSQKFFSKYTEVLDRIPLSAYREYNRYADTFVLGSDQIWNYTLFPAKKLSMYLDYVDNDKKKIAYASSFGFNYPTIMDKDRDLQPKISELLCNMDYIGVREDDGVVICKKYFETDSVHVIDPVFLLNKSDYEELSSNAVRRYDEEYLLTYTLKPRPDYLECIRKIASTLKLPRINMGLANHTKFNACKSLFDEPCIEDITMEEWINNIKNSKFIVTDSFHGTCFAIIFHKPFILIQEKWATSRIDSLLTSLNLKNRWFTSTKDLLNNEAILDEPIDYDSVDKLLNIEIVKSKTWLKNAIYGNKVLINGVIHSDAAIQRQYLGLLSSKTSTDYKDNLDKCMDIVYLVLKKGRTEKLPLHELFKNEDTTNLDSKAYGLIVDNSERYSNEAFDNCFVHMCYDIAQTNFTLLCEGFDNCGYSGISVFYVTHDGIKERFYCKEDGIHILVYSRNLNKIIDKVFIKSDKTLIR